MLSFFFQNYGDKTNKIDFVKNQRAVNFTVPYFCFGNPLGNPKNDRHLINQITNTYIFSKRKVLFEKVDFFERLNLRNLQGNRNVFNSPLKFHLRPIDIYTHTFYIGGLLNVLHYRFGFVSECFAYVL